MGRSLSNKIGVGFVLDWGEDGDELTEHQKSVLSKYLEDEDDDVEEAYYELLEDLVKKYPLLSTEIAYFDDYTYGYALLVRGTVTYGYGDILELDPAKFAVSNDEFDQLTHAMLYLGIQTDPKIISMVSYG